MNNAIYTYTLNASYGKIRELGILWARPHLKTTTPLPLTKLDTTSSQLSGMSSNPPRVVIPYFTLPAKRFAPLQTRTTTPRDNAHTHQLLRHRKPFTLKKYSRTRRALTCGEITLSPKLDVILPTLPLHKRPNRKPQQHASISRRSTDAPRAAASQLASLLLTHAKICAPDTVHAPKS